MKHALVVGGTSMLAGASLWLNSQGYHVSIIARNPFKMEKVMKRASSQENITPLYVDYTDGEKLRKAIRETIHHNGNIVLVVAWIHSIAEDALSIIMDEISKGTYEWELYHVLGSSSDLDAIKRKVLTPENCSYHQVQLGFVLEGAYSRWLTHQEISEGVIEAINRKKKVHVVGQLEPWEKRP